MTQPPSRAPRRESGLAAFVFAAGAILVMVAFIYSVARSWSSFDPLAMAVLVGVGLVLVVIYDRLGLILKELRAIVDVLEQKSDRS